MVHICSEGSAPGLYLTDVDQATNEVMLFVALIAMKHLHTPERGVIELQFDGAPSACLALPPFFFSNKTIVLVYISMSTQPCTLSSE